MTTIHDPVKIAVTQARRSQILDAAVTVFAEKGFHGATIKDVAKEAGVADGTIYNYFKNKEDLMISMVVQFAEINQFTDQAIELSEQADAAQILWFIVHNRLALLEHNFAQAQALLPQITSDPDLRVIFFEKLLRPAMVVFEKMWQTQIEKGQIRQLNPQVVMRSLLGMFVGMAFLAFLGDPFMRDNPEAIIEETIDLVLNGLLPPVADAGTEAQGV